MNPRNLKRLFINRRLHVLGRCNICGKRTLFFTKDAHEVGRVRESMFCLWCKSSSRKRHIAKNILELFAPQFASLPDAKQALSKFSIYSAVSNDPLHRFLGKDNENFICSEYFPDVEEGQKRDGVLCQNLERLMFADAQFDLVLTEDVFEHIRRPEMAFKEIYRVLKPHGYHIFSVPFYFDRKSLTRVDATTDEDIYLLPPAYHGDTLRDKILVYTDFGYDLFEQLSSLGFETKVSLSSHRDALLHGIADSYVLVSQKKKYPKSHYRSLVAPES